MNSFFVLRDAVSGIQVAAQDERPDGFGSPVLMGGTECYWAEEAFLPQLCRHCGGGGVSFDDGLPCPRCKGGTI